MRDEVRERVLFTPHNLLQDPPFSKLDLILCRNLLIYLQRPLQEQVFETFHYALHPRGYLFLGSAESTESITSLFEVVDKQHRIYRRGEQRQGTLVLPTLPLRPKHMHALEQVEESIAQGGSIDEMALPWLPENVAPPNLFVDAHYHVLQLSESAGRYLQHPAGALTPNVLRLVRPELQGELRTALFRALETEKATLTRSVPVQFNGAPHAVAMLIRPVRNGKEHLQALIFFLEDETPISENTTSVKETQSASFQQLQTELSHAQQQYQSLREEYETTVEELRSANEELQSTNEEYRSTVEELETSKEELQSINEELQTVNLELRSKVAETSQANSDLHNLFAATEIATLFLDRELKIKRYTPRAAELFNLMPGDQGRPISHLRTNLEYTELEQDARQVLKHLVPVVREIEGDQDHIFQVNVRPYRTQNDHIDGIVITFVDITGPKRAEAALYESQERLQLALATANMGTFIWYPAEDRGEPDARMLALFGQPANGALNLAEALSQMIHPDDSAGYAEAVAHATDPHGDGTLQTDIRVVHPNGDVRWLAITAQVYFAGEPRQAVRMVGTAIDITERKQIEATLRANDERQTFLLKLSDILHPLTDPIVVQAEACRLLGEQLGVDRAYYVEVDEVAGQARVHQNYLRDDSPSLVGSFPLVEVGWTVPYLQRGEVVIVADSQTDAIVPDADRGWMADLQMHAHITWPVIQQGKLMGALCVTERVPRVWTELDVELTSEAAERIGAAIVRARAEKALHESQQRYQQALAAAQMGTWRYDVVADINYFDERSQEIFGLDRATYTAAEVDSFVHPDDRAMLVQAREAALDPRGDGACHYVHRAIHPDGTVRWVRLNCQVTFAGEGQERHPVQAVGVITDVTERRETANALLASEERFRALVDASAQMVWTTDPQGAVVEDSPSWRAVTGQSYEEFAGRGWMDVIHPDDQSVTAAAWQEAVATVTPHHVECRVYDAASDQYRWHVVRAVPLQNADGSVRGWVGMNSDIQSRKVAEAALQALNESLEAQVAERTQQVRKLIMQLSMSEQEERQRISLVLHDDLQQRLYAIKFQLSFLRNVWNEPTDLSQEDKEQFFNRLEEQIQESLQQMRNLSIELSPPVLTGEGLDVALGWLATQMREQHGLSVHLQVQENFPSLSTKLRVLLFQIIREWLFNVVKHAGVLEAVVILNFTDETLQIEVIDEGKGFDEDVLQSDTYQGHGLQQNQRRLELIGATTKIVSSPEAGTHISLSCPLPAEERKGRT